MPKECKCLKTKALFTIPSNRKKVKNIEFV